MFIDILSDDFNHPGNKSTFPITFNTSSKWASKYIVVKNFILSALRVDPSKDKYALYIDMKSKTDNTIVLNSTVNGLKENFTFIFNFGYLNNDNEDISGTVVIDVDDNIVSYKKESIGSYVKNDTSNITIPKEYIQLDRDKVEVVPCKDWHSSGYGIPDQGFVTSTDSSMNNLEKNGSVTSISINRAAGPFMEATTRTV